MNPKVSYLLQPFKPRKLALRTTTKKRIPKSQAKEPLKNLSSTNSLSLKTRDVGRCDCLFGGWSVTVDGANSTLEDLDAGGCDFLGLPTGWAIGSSEDPTAWSTTSHVDGAGCFAVWGWDVVAGLVLSPSGHGPGRWEKCHVPEDIEFHELARWLSVLSRSCEMRMGL